MTPAVVATDLDGTIVRGDGTISPRTRAALGAARDCGALVVLVTGRPPRWLAGLAEATGHAGLAICANGALVYDLAAERVIDARPLAIDVVRRLVPMLRDAIPGLSFAVERVDGRFAHEPDYPLTWDPEPATLIGAIDDALTGPVTKLLARRVGMGADELLRRARSAVGDDVATLTHSSIEGLLEISALGVTKATTLAAFVAARGLSAADVIAFGDMPNDVAMLAWAGYSVAVAGAHPDVLDVVDEVAASIDDDGVAQVLERVYRREPPPTDLRAHNQIRRDTP